MAQSYSTQVSVLPAANGGIDAPRHASVAGSPQTADIELFNAEFSRHLSTGASKQKVSSDGISESMAKYVNDYEKTSNRFQDSLLKVAKDPAPSNMLDSLHEVSDYDIKTRLMAKMVGSGVKGLDKLTSMQ
ncbi:EscI/YscI/HrpB family type III secretion system inner rod protein [Salinicola avicenniae]|uniref:EscI/YscI/HrpB family type III secretion system inner rod protein n=1 Tax=Salinicola avicenniae TaxID=2916836 RepID=UPI0020730A51|nr:MULTISPECIES: EscI/YscI/HrpB family type III secretion system inner rod protein [unclassified Salinicola]